MSDASEIEVNLPDPLNDGYDQPMVVPDAMYAFPASLGQLLPPWDSIPQEFRDNQTEWNRFVSTWFFKGWPEDRDLYQRPDVDAEIAFRHLHTIMRSFEPKHEHKEAAVAWLMSRWFGAIKEKS